MVAAAAGQSGASRPGAIAVRLAYPGPWGLERPRVRGAYLGLAAGQAVNPGLVALAAAWPGVADEAASSPRTAKQGVITRRRR